MTTIFEIFIAGKDKGYARQAARAAFDEIDRIERLFSRFDPSSEISRVSRLRPGERMMVGVETVECLATAARVQAGQHRLLAGQSRFLAGQFLSVPPSLARRGHRKPSPVAAAGPHRRICSIS
ncbi:MAG: FAD:protein FMN transferase [Candidatus Aminicenantales bacterium]